MLTLGRLTQAAVDRGYLPHVTDAKRWLGRRDTAQPMPLKLREQDQVVSMYAIIYLSEENLTLNDKEND